VYYTVKNQVGTVGFQPNRPASAYTVPFNVIDPGPDGITGNSDDQTLQAFGIPTSLISGCAATQTTPSANCAYPANQVIMNTPDIGSYKTFELSVNKRQSHNYSASAGFGYTWQHDFTRGFPNTPNGPFDYDFTIYSFKANAIYNAPWGINISPVFRFQAGANYARTLNVAAPASCACTFSAANGGPASGPNGSSTGNSTVYATSWNAFRQDNIAVVDLRVEKTVPLGAAKVRVFFDGFNLANQYAGETISMATGSAFQQPTAILAPRTGRIGFRLIW
jgi:hypothetical protein